jgi:DNA polymerase III epsilon subunit-like protein
VLKEPVVRLHEASADRYEVSDVDIRGLSRLRIWVFDLEATGLDTTRERITQIAGVPLQRGAIVEAEGFSQLVDPGPDVEISKEVQELTGITRERLAGAPRLPEAWAACVAAARGCDLWIGQSVFEFDVPLLRAEFARHGMPPALPPMLDSVVLATALLGEPEGRWSTSALLQRFRVNTDGLRRHDALDDVLILGRILLPLLEMLRDERADHLFIPPEKRLSIKRHPSR